MGTNLHEQSSRQDNQRTIWEYSAYNMGWLLVMFDLPVVETDDRSKAAKFRRELLKAGFTMIQESFYARPCMTSARVQTAYREVERLLPGTGVVMTLFVTDHQWFTAHIATKTACSEVERTLPGQAEIWDDSGDNDS